MLLLPLLGVPWACGNRSRARLLASSRPIAGGRSSQGSVAVKRRCCLWASSL